ncbi:MAG: phosphoglycerate dehydrogenase, partial [Actinomycetota bacterium]|nr:phosphoglycerate dehydrogenase [Actinomycetota bacterium]
MTVTVLVPDHHGVAALAGLDDLHAVPYVSYDDLPPEAARARVLVPDFMSRPIPANLTERLPELRLVQTLTAGADGWIGMLPDTIAVSTARGAHGGSTAEWAVAALLAIYRDLLAYEDDRRAGRWARRTTDTLQDKRILVVGAGDLGANLRRRFDAFDAHTTLVATKARDGVRGVDELATLLPRHDAVIMVVPLTAATERMVDADFLARMRDGAVLVNAARGPVVDSDALLAELTSGRLRAALDVTDPEPLPEGHPLWT